MLAANIAMKRQVVIALDRDFSTIEVMVNYFKANFKSTQLFEILAPDDSLKRAYLEKLTELYDLPDDVKQFLLNIPHRGLYSIKGALSTIIMRGIAERKALPFEFTKTVFQEKGESMYD